MENSQSIIKIAAALVVAQKEMGNAVKDTKNTFFKSSYADINSVREACMPLLNKNGISVLQPMITIEGKNYIQTVLLHESGEFLISNTEIVYSKQNDAQSQGSGITYARRYGLQSFLSLGTEDDDGNIASNHSVPTAVINPTKGADENGKTWLNLNTEQFTGAVKYLKEGGTMENILSKYKMRADTKEELLRQVATPA